MSLGVALTGICSVVEGEGEMRDTKATRRKSIPAVMKNFFFIDVLVVYHSVKYVLSIAVHYDYATNENMYEKEKVDRSRPYSHSCSSCRQGSE